MTQFLQPYIRNKDTDCLASLRAGEVLNGSSHVKVVGGWNCDFCGMGWEQSRSEFSTWACLKQHRGARQGGWHPTKGGEETGWRGVAGLAERALRTLGFPWGGAWLPECPGAGRLPLVLNVGLGVKKSLEC